MLGSASFSLPWHPVWKLSVNPVDSSWRIHVTLPSQFETASLVHATDVRSLLEPPLLFLWSISSRGTGEAWEQLISGDVIPFAHFAWKWLSHLSVPQLLILAFLALLPTFCSPAILLTILALGGPQLYAGTFHSDLPSGSSIFSLHSQSLYFGAKLLGIN